MVEVVIVMVVGVIMPVYMSETAGLEFSVGAVHHRRGGFPSPEGTPARDGARLGSTDEIDSIYVGFEHTPRV